MRKRWPVVFAALMASAQAVDPVPRPALSYLVAAFDRYPLVGLSEVHGARETTGFVAALIRQPGFAGKVNDIVVECGNARYQAVIDRYINGGNVPIDELRQVWENTTQVTGLWSSPIYAAFFADVRAFNATLPAAKRVRVLLGDPPIDWAQVTSPADEDMNDWRDAHFAWVVEQEVIRKGRKALLFIGGAHLGRRVMFPNSLIHLLDRRLPGKTLVVQTIDVTGVKARVASLMRAWPVPSAAEVRGTWLGAADVSEVAFRFSRGRVAEDFDVVLHLSAKAFSNTPPVIDSEYARELERRRKLGADTLPFRGGQIRFAHAAATFTQESESALETVLAELRRDAGLEVVVKGHTDSTEPHSGELSQARANLVREWLAGRGIPRRRLTTLACGASRPSWYSDTDEHRAANRRIELVRKSKWSGCQPPASWQ